MTAPEYVPRLADGVLGGLLEDFAGVMINGARATGKTTTAARHAASIFHLDDPEEAAAFLASPASALAGAPKPILLDEWQAVPDVLGVVKRAIDSSRERGQFIVAGSVRDTLLKSSWPITGRLVTLEMSGLTVREQAGRDVSPTPFLRRLVDAGLDAIRPPEDPPDLRGYVELAVQGGFPEPVLELPAGRRPRWYRSYLDRLLTQDAAEINEVRDPVRLRRFFNAYALNTAGEVSDRALYEAASVDHRTAAAYERLLQTLLLVESLPAWSTNRMKRLVRAPKRYVRDPGLAAAAMELDVEGSCARGASSAE